MTREDRPKFDVGAFASSLALAAFASTATVIAIAQAELLLSGRAVFVFAVYPAGMFAAVAIVTVLVSAGPAMIASDRRWGIVQASLAGGVVGLIAILAIIVVSAGVLSPERAWQALSANFIFVPVFGVSGLVGGLTFGLIQKALLPSALRN